MRRPLIVEALALALALAPLARAADAPISEEAKLHFQAGVNLLKDPDGARYEEAYREFRTAYSASNSYKVLGNLALCAMKLERDGEAVDAYQKYLEHAAELDPGEVQQIKTDLATLKAGLVALTLNVDQPGVSVSDVRLPTRGDKITNLYGPYTEKSFQIGVRAGHHVVTIKLTGYDDFSWEFDAKSGAPVTKDIVLKKVEVAASAVTSPAPGAEPDLRRPEPSKGPQAGFYIGLATTGAFAAGTVIVGLMALSNKSEFKDVNNGFNPPSARDLEDKGKTLNLVTDLLLGGTVVAAGITTYLAFNRGASKKTGTLVVPAVTANGGGVVVSGPLF
ncbi:MAG TPA: hypothetical protein VJT73_09695 [Polyangiaceae bacterium]|nr:hypothetical protein [Polyangiaceae bacterium]